MDKTNSPVGIVRRKADFLPVVFQSNEFDNALIARLSLCFKTLIVRANCDGDASWQKLKETLRVHGLLELKVPQELILNPLTIEVARKGGEKEIVSYTTDEPLSFGFETLALDLDRARLSEGSYLSEVASIYAYLFTWRLFMPSSVAVGVPKSVESNGSGWKRAGLQDASSNGAASNGADSSGAALNGAALNGADCQSSISDGAELFAAASLVLPHIDSVALGQYLRKHHRGEVSAASLMKFLLGRKIEPLLDELPIFRAFDDIAARVSRRLSQDLANSRNTGAESACLTNGSLTKDTK